MIPYWEDKCPVCDGKVVAACKCMINHRVCEKGHTWHWVNGQAVMGTGH